MICNVAMKIRDQQKSNKIASDHDLHIGDDETVFLSQHHVTK